MIDSMIVRNQDGACVCVYAIWLNTISTSVCVVGRSQQLCGRD
jgi:hypothetical protein